MARKRATIRDVARLSGYSTTAVSNALNNRNARIPEETREKIREAARKLHYAPNALIRAMHTGRTNVIGLYMVFPHVPVGQFFSALLFSLQERLAGRGYDLLLHRRAAEDEAPDDGSRFLDGRIDGLFYWGAERREFIDSLSEREFPVVGLFSAMADAPSGRVWADEKTGLREALEALVRLGHKRVVCPPYQFDSPAVELRRKALDELKGEMPIEIVQSERREAGGRREYFKALFRSDDPPTALIAGGAQQGYQALAEAQRAGLRTPEDISILCHEGFEIERGFDMAGIIIPVDDICREAVTMLLNLIEGGSLKQTSRAFPTRFNPGRTIGPPRH